MMKTASKRYLLSDSSKIGKKTFCKVSDLKDFACLITDDGVSQEDVSAIRKQGIDVIVCSQIDIEDQKPQTQDKYVAFCEVVRCLVNNI